MNRPSILSFLRSFAFVFLIEVSLLQNHRAATFSSDQQVQIRDSVPSSPYPSIINVAGLEGNIFALTVTLRGFTHSYPADVDILLVSPSGYAVTLLSDAGFHEDVAGINLTFSDSANAGVPEIGQLVSGTFKPSNYGDGIDFFAAPAPPGPYGGTLTDFNSTPVNGQWKLFITDDIASDSGSLLGWSLEILTSQPPVIQCPANITVCYDRGDPTGVATAVSQCGGQVNISFEDSVISDDGTTRVTHREWTATDLCGTSRCVQVITEERPRPNIQIFEEGFLNETLKDYSFSSSLSFVDANWTLRDGFGNTYELSPGDPGVTRLASNRILVNFLQFRGGEFLGAGFDILVRVNTACTFGDGSRGSGTGGIPLYILSRGTPTVLANGTEVQNNSEIDSNCGRVNGGAPAFEFRAQESGLFEFRSTDQNARLLVIRNLSAYPLQAVACTNTSDSPILIPVTQRESLFVMATASDGSVEVTAKLNPLVPILFCPPNTNIPCYLRLDNLDVTGRASAQSFCPNGTVQISYTDRPHPTESGILREWIAIDACGTNSCTQVITQQRFTPPRIIITERSLQQEIIKEFSLSVDQPIQRFTWFTETDVIRPDDPGVVISTANTNITINFLVFRGGVYLGKPFTLRVEVLTPCTGGQGGGSFPVGSPPLFILSRGGGSEFRSTPAYFDTTIVTSVCGTVSASSPVFRVQAAESGELHLSLKSPLSRLIVIRDLSSFPWPTIACTNSGRIGIPVVSRTVTAGEILYVMASSGSGGVEVTAALADIRNTQSILFRPLTEKILSPEPFRLTATASSGLPVTFEVVSGPAIIAGDLLTMTGLGEVTVRASQLGNDSFRAADSTERKFQVRLGIIGAKMENGVFTFAIGAQLGKQYLIEWSDDFVQWHPAGEFSSSSGSIKYVENIVSVAKNRYFRASQK